MNDEPEVITTAEPDVTRRRLLAGALAGGALVMGGAVRAAGDHAAHDAGGKGSMMYMPGHDMRGTTVELPGAPDDTEVTYREFDLTVEMTQHELLPGVTLPVFAFNGQVPGPMFRVNEFDWVKVNVLNKTEEMHTIHWHGVDLIYTMDGVPMVSHDPIHPEQTLVYRFQARPHGTRFYHCHWSTPLHAMSAMHGAFIIDTPHDPIRRQFPYTREYVLALQAFDVHFTRNHLNALLGGMKRVNKMMANRTLTPLAHGFFKRYEDFLAAMKKGWRPPYTAGNAENTEIKPTFFAINGKCYPATVGELGHLKIKRGEYIRIRIISASWLDHHMHLHGHQFWVVAEDGNPLPAPYKRLNTLPCTPGKTWDIIVYGDNPGYWDFHDHKELHTRNNGIHPGGMITMLEYEDLGDAPYVPSISVNQ